MSVWPLKPGTVPDRLILCMYMTLMTSTDFMLQITLRVKVHGVPWTLYTRIQVHTCMCNIVCIIEYLRILSPSDDGTSIHFPLCPVNFEMGQGAVHFICKFADLPSMYPACLLRSLITELSQKTWSRGKIQIRWHRRDME